MFSQADNLFYLSIRADDRETIQNLCKTRNMRRTFEYGSALTCAIRTNRELLEMVKLLINSGADVNSCDPFDMNSPIHLAVERGYVDVLGILINSGGNVNAVNKRGDTPLHIAVTKPIPEQVRLLIQAGANVDAFDKCKFTPLHRAVAENVQLLIDSGADINMWNNDPIKSIIRNAIYYGSPEKVRILTYAGACVNSLIDIPQG